MKINEHHNAWLLSALAAALLGCPNINAASLPVTSFADSGSGTLRNQIAAAASGDDTVGNQVYTTNSAAGASSTRSSTLERNA